MASSDLHCDTYKDPEPLCAEKTSLLTETPGHVKWYVWERLSQQYHTRMKLILAILGVTNLSLSCALVLCLYSFHGHACLSPASGQYDNSNMNAYLKETSAYCK